MQYRSMPSESHLLRTLHLRNVLMRHDCGADSTINPSVQLCTVKHQQMGSRLPSHLNRVCFHVLLLSVYLSQHELPVVRI